MPNGYHKIQTIFQEIPEIYDEIIIKTAKTKNNLSIIHKNNKLPIQSQQNLAQKALQLFKKTYKINKFASIIIKKNIPISSGLGGAASNAAATIKGLNKLWDLKLSQKQLLKLAVKLGKDAPFFIIGGTALGTNYGEKITPLPPLKNIKFKIFPKSSKTQNKTRTAYNSLDLKKCGKKIQKTKKLLTAIKNNNAAQILKNLHNDFETILPPPKNHHLCGCGPSTFIAETS